MLRQHCRACFSCTLACFTMCLVSIRFLGVLRIRWWLRIWYLIKRAWVIDQNVKFVKTPTNLKDGCATFDSSKIERRYSSRLKAHEKCYNSLFLLHQLYIWFFELWPSIYIFAEKNVFFLFLLNFDRKTVVQKMIKVNLRPELPHVSKATKNATIPCFYFITLLFDFPSYGVRLVFLSKKGIFSCF